MNSKIVAIFFSEKADLNLGYRVKSLLTKFGIYTIYLKELEDILFKKFNDIEFLVLDFVEQKLDDRSLGYIKKLYDDNFIKRVLILKDVDDKTNYPFESINYDEDFAEQFIEQTDKLLNKKVEEKKVFDSCWVKIISDFLSSIGFSLKNAGFITIVDTIIYLLLNGTAVSNFNKIVYPYLANKYGKNKASIEMNIRKSIHLAFSHKKNFPFDYCPTNKEFITYAITEVYDKIFVRRVI